MPRYFYQLSGAELDYWVARAEGLYGGDLDIRPFWGCSYYDGTGLRSYSPSTHWDLAGEIITREQISTLFENVYPDRPWHAFITVSAGKSTPVYEARGQTPLEAAMRVYIFKKLGPVVDNAAGEAATPLVLPGATPPPTMLAAVADMPDDHQDAWL
jgi:hypothetical protein